MNKSQLPPKKSLGQHWLSDERSLEAICQDAQVGSGDTVLEIGPGTGELTEKIISAGAKVIALEIDDSLFQTLQHRFKDKDEKFTLVHGDIRTYDLTSLPEQYKIIANIPYYLTSHLFRIISETENPPTAAALLVQKEVAQRVAASPGQMSLLAVTVQFYWQVTLGQVVPARLFTPPPKVDSQIVILGRRASPLFLVDETKYFEIVKAGFSARRKKLRSSLSGGLRISKQEAEAVLRSAEVNPDERAQSLSLRQWHDIYRAVQSQNE